MELRHLHYFVVLAHRLHFTQAAEELLIAQPALSQQIQALEREFGVLLFERTSRYMRLTPAGEALLPRAEQLLAEATSLQAEMQSFSDLKRGRLQLGLLQSLGTYWLSGFLARFHVHYPGIEIVLHEEVTETMIEQLEKRTLDLAWMHRIDGIFPTTPPGKHVETLAVVTEPLVFAVAPQHRLVQQQPVMLSDVLTEEVVLFKPGSGLRQALLHCAQQAGIVPHVIFESSDISSIRALVSEGVGISIFPHSVINAPGRGIVALKCESPLPQRTILLAWDRRRSSLPAIQAFLEFFRGDLLAHPWR